MQTRLYEIHKVASIAAYDEPEIFDVGRQKSGRLGNRELGTIRGQRIGPTLMTDDPGITHDPLLNNLWVRTPDLDIMVAVQ